MPVRLKNRDNIGVITKELADYGDKWGMNWSSFIGTKWHTKGGADTTDKVWLLSLEEVKKYKNIFRTDKDRQLKPMPDMETRYNYCTSEYCRKNGVVGNAWWWLRSPGHSQLLAAFVRSVGFVDPVGADVDDDSGGVRAALKINLKNL